MKLQFNFQAIKCDNTIWQELKLSLISALKQEMKTRTINVEINETDFSNLNTGFNIVMFAGDEWPELPPNRTFCIFLSTKFFPKYLGKMKYAGVTTPKLLLSGPKILIGKKEVFEKMKVRLDLYQSPTLKKRNNYFKATVIDDTSWAEVIIKYVLEYIDQHPMPGLDN